MSPATLTTNPYSYSLVLVGTYTTLLTRNDDEDDEEEEDDDDDILLRLSSACPSAKSFV